MLNLILNLIYPPKCVFCRTPLEPNCRDWVCLDCLNSLPYCVAKPRCRVCGKPAASADIRLCPTCRQNRRHYTRIISVFEYSGKVRDSLIRYKANSLKRYGREYARFMSALVQMDYGKIKFDLIAAIPPSKKRMREKGFDQSGFLAKELAGRLSLPYVKNVMFQRESRAKQSSLSSEERAVNVRQNFAVKKPDTVRGKTVLLVDDICTTGATLEEGARALREAGAARIYAVTAATTVKLWPSGQP